MDTSQDLQLDIRMSKAVAPGESVSVTIEVVSIKGKAGGSPVELNIDPIPAAAAAAGMTHIAQCSLTTYVIICADNRESRASVALTGAARVLSCLHVQSHSRPTRQGQNMHRTDLCVTALLLQLPDPLQAPVHALPPITCRWEA